MKLSFTGRIPRRLIVIFCKHFRIRPCRINEGWCYQFALVLKMLYGNQVKLYSDYDHCWIRHNNLCYDTVHCAGCSEKDITTYGSINKMSTQETVDYWNDIGVSSIRINTLKRIAEEYYNEVSREKILSSDSGQGVTKRVG